MILRHDIFSDRRLTPSYALPTDELSAAECEVLVLHAVRLNRRLTSKSDAPPILIPFHQSRSVTWVRLIKGQWLLLATSDKNTSVLSIWSLASLSAMDDLQSPVSEAFLDGPVANGLVDMQNDTLTCALEIRAALYVPCFFYTSFPS